MSRKNLRRRKFLQIGASAAASGTLISCSGSRSRWRFFSLEQARIVNAMCERLIPADRDPGASWAGVVNFIDLQLTRVYRDFQPLYKEGIAAAEKTARVMFGAAFLELPPSRQDAVLAAMEKAPETRPFFDALLAHTMQGFYGSPRHGGNRDEASWRMLGVPAVPIRGQARYDLSRKG